MTGITIRPFQASDTGTVTEIYAQAVREDTATFEIDAPDVAEMARRIAGIIEAGHPFLVAELDAVVSGYAYASTFRQRAAFASTLEDSVYVASFAQRRGVGQALLEGLINSASSLGFSQMVAVIGDSATKSASVALHMGAGFRETGTLTAVGRKHDRWLDIIFMQRALSEIRLNRR